VTAADLKDAIVKGTAIKKNYPVLGASPVTLFTTYGGAQSADFTF
jgi:hypothetical protein